MAAYTSFASAFTLFVVVACFCFVLEGVSRGLFLFFYFCCCALNVLPYIAVGCKSWRVRFPPYFMQRCY